MPIVVDDDFLRDFQNMRDKVAALERNAARFTTPSVRGFNAKKVANQSIAANTDVVIVSEAVDVNTGGYNETTGRFTVPEGMTGTWLFGGQCQLQTGGASMNFNLRLNASAIRVFGYSGTTPAAGFTVLSGSAICVVKTGDILDAVINSGNANTVLPFTSFFGVFLGV